MRKWKICNYVLVSCSGIREIVEGFVSHRCDVRIDVKSCRVVRERYTKTRLARARPICSTCMSSGSYDPLILFWFTRRWSVLVGSKTCRKSTSWFDVVGIFIVYASSQSTARIRIVPHGGSSCWQPRFSWHLFVFFARFMNHFLDLVSFSADWHSRFQRDKRIFETKITRKQEDCVRIDRIDETRRVETKSYPKSLN